MKTLLSVLALALFSLTGCDTLTPETSSAATSLAKPSDSSGGALAMIRSHTARYHRVDVALDAGYEEVSDCVESPLGGMGFHYLDGELLDDIIDPSAPELLLYEPGPNGRLRLVGVEFMVPAAAWPHDAPPSLEGVEFAAHLTEETQHDIPFPHYDLHVWSWRDNPSGMFAPFNPNVSCAGAE